MKSFVLAILMLVSTLTFAENDEVGRLKTESLKRTYDPEYSVVCYSIHYSNLSCVYVPQKAPQKPRTNSNEDIPE
jgi:hypothetical protein